MANGVTTNNLTASALVDSVVGSYAGSTVRIEIARLVALVTALLGPTYATRAELYADLAWPDGSVGYVRSDATSAYNGVYRKIGATGTGSWSRVSDLPTSSVEAAQIASEIARATAAEGALQTEMRAGRVYTMTGGSSPSGLVVPVDYSVDLLAMQDGAAGTVSWWRRYVLTPEPTEETDTLKQDAGGVWWQRRDDLAVGLVAAEQARATAAEALKAPLASPALTGTPTVPTAAPGTNTTQAASTAFVAAGLAAAVGTLTQDLAIAKSAWYDIYFAWVGGVKVHYANGSHPSVAGFGYGDIPVTPGEVLLVTGLMGGADTAMAVFYDAGGAYLGYYLRSPETGSASYTDHAVRVPAGATKMSVSTNVGRPVVKRAVADVTLAEVRDYVPVDPTGAIVTGAYLAYNTGLPVASASYAYQKFAVTGGATYYVSGYPVGNAIAAAVWYDAAGNYLSYTDQQDNVGNNYNRHPVVAPAGAAFVGLTQPVSKITSGSPMRVERAGLGGRVGELEAQSVDLVSRVAAIERAGAAFQPVYHPERLRRTSVALQKRAAGEAVQHHVQLLGDSWLDTKDFFTLKLRNALTGKYGDGGIGWISAAGLSSALAPGASLARFGTWATVDETAAGPDITSATTNDTATPARLSVQLTDGRAASGARLFYRGAPGLQISYSWNLATATTITLETSGVHALDIPGAGFGTGTGRRLDLRLISGTLEAFGVDVADSAPGVILHKCANNGSMASDWAAVSATDWQDGVTALGADLVVICLGTNDRSPNTPAVTFAAGVQEIINRARAALPASGGVPYVDILLIVPHNIPRSGPPVRDMGEYRAALYALADANDCAVCDLYGIIGSNPYDKMSHFDGAGYHPSETVGGWAVMGVLGQFFGV